MAERKFDDQGFPVPKLASKTSWGRALTSMRGIVDSLKGSDGAAFIIAHRGDNQVEIVHQGRMNVESLLISFLVHVARSRWKEDKYARAVLIRAVDEAFASHPRNECSTMEADQEEPGSKR